MQLPKLYEDLYGRIMMKIPYFHQKDESSSLGSRPPKFTHQRSPGPAHWSTPDRTLPLPLSRLLSILPNRNCSNQQQQQTISRYKARYHPWHWFVLSLGESNSSFERKSAIWECCQTNCQNGGVKSWQYQREQSHMLLMLCFTHTHTTMKRKNGKCVLLHPFPKWDPMYSRRYVNCRSALMSI